MAASLLLFGAFIPLLLFIFPGASSHCHTGTENECEKHTAFVPGHSLVGRGIDVTTMARKGANLVDSSLWQHEDGTCTLCRNPLQGEQWQRLPLAAVDWRIHVSCHQNLSSSVQQSAMGMMESVASPVQNDWKMGLDVTVKPKVNVQVALAGSHSKLASFVIDHMRMDKYSFISHKVSCGYYSSLCFKGPNAKVTEPRSGNGATWPRPAQSWDIAHLRAGKQSGGIMEQRPGEKGAWEMWLNGDGIPVAPLLASSPPCLTNVAPMTQAVASGSGRAAHLSFSWQEEWF
uniref:Perforin-1-like n=1 Tax=Chelonoidis abingdonii TaxID=106734 RepID=A0A8C0QNZ0_CHEAB